MITKEYLIKWLEDIKYKTGQEDGGEAIYIECDRLLKLLGSHKKRYKNMEKRK